MISIPLPTIKGREHHLEKAIAAYEAYADVEIILVEDSPTCGYGWTVGADKATGDYIHFGADDVEMLPGWAEAAIAACERAQLPAPIVFNTDGSVQSCGGSWGVEEPDGQETGYSRGPFIKREWWDFIGPIPTEMHYYTDDFVTWRCRENGIPPVVCHGYQYVHHLAAEGRVHNAGACGSIYMDFVEGRRTA